MVRLEVCSFEPWHFHVGASGSYEWCRAQLRKGVKRLPQIFWKDGSGWAEANVWALQESVKPRAHEDTVSSKMRHLHAYAKYLDANNLDWRHFPTRIDERSLVKFRGHLLRRVESGNLAITTASVRMSAVIQFYRFAQAKKLVHSQNPPWEERAVVIRYVDSVGFNRSMTRTSTNLHIPIRRRIGESLEDGLLPLSASDTKELVAYIQANESSEMGLMILIGLFTGARIGTITTLTKQSIRSARPDPQLSDIKLIRIGPGTDVKTKFDVSGDLMFPVSLLKTIELYIESTERLKREMRTPDGDKPRVFLTRRGRPYSVETVDRLIEKLRKKAIAQGLTFMDRFKFHQTRATFGTQLMKLLLQVMNATNAIDFVRSAMHHKSEATTFKYIKFLESSKAKQELAEAYTRLFVGVDEYRRNGSEA